jgi:hypothetical protein
MVDLDLCTADDNPEDPVEVEEAHLSVEYLVPRWAEADYAEPSWGWTVMIGWEGSLLTDEGSEDTQEGAQKTAMEVIKRFCERHSYQLIQSRTP